MREFDLHVKESNITQTILQLNKLKKKTSLSCSKWVQATQVRG